MLDYANKEKTRIEQAKISGEGGVKEVKIEEWRSTTVEE
jgi:hypothetical protein